MQGGSWLWNKRVKIAGLVLLAAALLAVILWLGVRYGWPLAAGLLAALVGVGAALVYAARERTALIQQGQQEQQQVESTRARLAESERRLDAALQINRLLAESSAGRIDSSALMDSALSTITQLVGALGCSYVPIDEWRQPLPAFTHGQLPDPVLGAWSAELASGMLRERCAACSVHKSAPGACPLHPAELGSFITVYCVTQNAPGAEQTHASLPAGPRAQSPRGILHLYMPGGKSLDAEMSALLDDLLHQVTIAFEAARLRQQEQATLRQLQLLRAPQGEFYEPLQFLLQGLVQALEVDFALTRVLPTPIEDPSIMQEQFGDFSQLSQEALDGLLSQAMQAAARGEALSSPPRQAPVWLSLPLLPPARPPPVAQRVPSGQPLPAPADQPLGAYADQPPAALGILLVGAYRPFEFHQRQLAILQSIAAQAAWFVEMERVYRALQYKTVVQERARLAREIHDGLAQDLAFLKLQAAQMQTYLTQGDLSRLQMMMESSYAALSSAYLDARQAIDDLRLTPRLGLEQWLERILADFEQAAGLPVDRQVRPLSRALDPEVQAQLIRIIQEALSNIRKHARASRVRVALFERGGEILLEIADDGRGFDAEDVPELTRHGLRGMRERADILGADFQIISQASRGTTMRLVLPAFHTTASIAEEPS